MAGPVITPMTVERTAIEGLVVISLKQVAEERGVVREFYRESAWIEAGLPSLGKWLQTNVTETKRGGLRGLHGEDMHKLVGVVSGAALGAYVDMRPRSGSFQKVVTVELIKGRQVLVPAGVCNGFQATAEETQYVYCFDAEWVPGMTGAAVNPLDPALGIDWPIPVDADDPSQLSAKDAAQPSLEEAAAKAGG
jgi:dTDP-4-dehydrorhamnose 3,5-epimerase